MGRKIPAKKHRGVKDPLKQQAIRLQSVKGKINAPPKEPDEQPVPRSVTRLFAFLNKDSVATKRNKKSKHTASKDSVGPASGVGENPIACLKKLPGESGRSFSLRINSAIRTLHDPLEQEYPGDLEVEDVKGEQMEAQRARRRRKRGRGADCARVPAETLGGSQRRAPTNNAKKTKQTETVRPELVYERVPFGDVTHAPPALAPRPRRAVPLAPAAAATAAPLSSSQRPGRRELLLSAMLPGGGAGEQARVAAERRRLAAVEAYRSLKKERQKRRSTRRK